MKPPAPNDGTMCPLWKKACHRVCQTCAWWNLVRGKHPQTGADIDTWRCAIALMPVLQIENAMVGRQTTASVDELRKEVRTANDQAIIGTIGRLNAEMNTQLAAPSIPQKLLEQ